MASTKATGAIGGAASGASAGAAFGPYGAAIGGVVGGITGFLGGGAEDDAKKLAKLQADMIGKATEENLRTARMEMGRAVGGAVATVGASNLQFSGTSKQYTNAMAAEFKRNMNWQRVKGSMEAEAAKMGGTLTANKIEAAGVSSMMSGLGSAAKSGLLGSYNKDEGYTWDPWNSK